MEIFGERWRDHGALIEAAWRASVATADVVCLPGDLSWALRLPEAAGELAWLGTLPGRKVLVKGNHDYWWDSIGKVRRALPEGVFALQNDAVHWDGATFGGARGWVDPSLDFRALGPGAQDPSPPGEGRLHGIRGEDEDRRLYRRELERLETSLRAMDPGAALRVALLHFPPTSPALEPTPVTELLERYAIDAAVFGHLHGAGAERFENPYGERNGVRYYLVSADFAHFAPVLVGEV